MILCISVLSVVISPYPLLVLLIWFFSLCFLMSLANGLSILFILSNHQFLALLIFAMISFVSFAFISALSFKISFLLLTLGFFISSFSSCFRCSVQFSSVTHSCLALCDPMNCSTSCLPVHHQLPEFTQTHVHQVGDGIQPSHPLLSPSPPALNPSQHQGLFQWVNSSHEVAKVLEFQLQHHSFQRTPRTGLLQNGLVGFPCSPRDSQESSLTPQFKTINSSVFSFLHSPTLTSIHDHCKNHSLD